MLVADFLVLLIILGVGGLGTSGIIAGAKNMRQKRKALENANKQMFDDLRDALNSQSYKKLDDFLVLYADRMSETTKKHVQQRRDELYIEQE